MSHLLQHIDQVSVHAAIVFTAMSLGILAVVYSIFWNAKFWDHAD